MLSFPHAKINIGLYVVNKRPDGYHDLETVFFPIPLQDVLETKPLMHSNKPYMLQTVGVPIGDDADNLVVRVYLDMKKEFQLPALDIYLQKRIPMGAGLGGGSSDAAYMMKSLNDDFNLGLTLEEMERRVSRYGADCAFFIREYPAFAVGIGDQLTPYPLSLKDLTLVLVKPPVSVSTKEAYGGVTPRRPQYDLRESLKRPIEEWKHYVFNDFEESVFLAHPEIAAIKQTLYDMGALYASMSGSGSTVFGIFKHPADEVQNVFKDCFVFRQHLRL